jgi:uncharacterized membrane protein YgdD (TMEM256/DUF423 family)
MNTTKAHPENGLAPKMMGASGAILGLLAVALGAFGAHALEGRLTAEELATFETAVRYQMYHALALVAVAGLMKRRSPGTELAGGAFLVGILLFSGSLYLLVLTGESWLGAVTPLGGLAYLAGWLALAWSFVKT